jgi:hypothetical protein
MRTSSLMDRCRVDLAKVTLLRLASVCLLATIGLHAGAADKPARAQVVKRHAASVTSIRTRPAAVTTAGTSAGRSSVTSLGGASSRNVQSAKGVDAGQSTKAQSDGAPNDRKDGLDKGQKVLSGARAAAGSNARFTK